MRRERLGECFFRIRLPPFVRAAAFSIGSACLLLCRIAVLAKVGCLILMPTTVGRGPRAVGHGPRAVGRGARAVGHGPPAVGHGPRAVGRATAYVARRSAT